MMAVGGRSVRWSAVGVQLRCVVGRTYPIVSIGMHDILFRGGEEGISSVCGAWWHHAKDACDPTKLIYPTGAEGEGQTGFHVGIECPSRTSCDDGNVGGVGVRTLMGASHFST